MTWTILIFFGIEYRGFRGNRGESALGLFYSLMKGGIFKPTGVYLEGTAWLRESRIKFKENSEMFQVSTYGYPLVHSNICIDQRFNNQEII